jgi:hypothetical protein
MKINIECSEKEAKKILNIKEKPILNIRKGWNNFKVWFNNLTIKQRKSLFFSFVLVSIILLTLCLIGYSNNQKDIKRIELEKEYYLKSIEDKPFLDVLFDYLKLKIYTWLPLLFGVVCISWIIHGVGFRII